MARPEGFEPPTQGLELPGSVQAELRAHLCSLKILAHPHRNEAGFEPLDPPVKPAGVKTCSPICR